MISIKIDTSALRSALKDIDKFIDSKKEEVKNQVAYSALEIEKLAKQDCPVKTGRLRSSIHTEFSSDRFSAQVGTNVKYAPAVEFGEKGRQAKPFLFPASEIVRSKYLSAIRKIFKV